MGSPSKLLTTGRVAKLCGFSTSAVLQWIRTGKLAAFSSPGGQYRVCPDELLRFLHAHGMHVPEELAPPGPHRVLIVDDEEVVRDVLLRMLDLSGIPCTVETAENGVVGCMKLPMFRPDLVLLDIVMPELDGVEFVRSLKASDEFARARVLLVTGYATDDRLQAALDAGADDWLSKPVEYQPFARKVAELLGIDPETLDGARHVGEGSGALEPLESEVCSPSAT